MRGRPYNTWPKLPAGCGMRLAPQATRLRTATGSPKRLTEMRVGPAEIRRESYAGRTMSLSLLHELGAIV